MLLQRLSHCTKGRLRCTAAAEPCQPFRPAQHGRSTRAECCGCGNFLSSSAPFGQKKRLRFAGGPPDWRRAPFNAGEGMPEARRNRHNRHTTQQTQRRGTFCETVQIQQINDRQQQLSAGKLIDNRAKFIYIHLVWAIFTSSYSAAEVLGGTCHWLSPSWGGRGGRCSCPSAPRSTILRRRRACGFNGTAFRQGTPVLLQHRSPPFCKNGGLGNSWCTEFSTHDLTY